MAKRPKKKRRVSKAELRRRAVKGWETRRRRYSQGEISLQAAKGARVSSLLKEVEQLQSKLNVAENRVRKQNQEITEFKGKIDKIDTLEKAIERLEKFLPEEIELMKRAHELNKFHTVAEELAKKKGMRTREIYLAWFGY